MPRRRWILVVAAVLVAAATTTAHARATPITAKRLFALTAAADAMPQQLAADDFSTTSSSLTNRVADSGQTWLPARGTMPSNGSYLRCTTCIGDYAAGVLDVDLTTVTASVNVYTGGNGQAGLVMDSDAAVTSAFFVLYGGGAIQVVRFMPTGVTFSNDFPVTGLPKNTFVPLVVTYTGTAFTIRMNNKAITTYAVSAADQAVIAGHSHFGVVIYDESSNGSDRLDNFTVTR